MSKRKGSAIIIAMAVLIGFIAMPAGAADKPAATQAININTATVDQLKTLNGIGDVIAARIIEYREANGPFKVPEDIMKVKGIGDKKFEKIKDIITVGTPPAEKKKKN